MAYPTEIQALPADPADLSPESLREFYEQMRSCLLSIVTEMGADPGGGTSAATRIAALETANAVIGQNTQTANYTLVLADAGKVVEMNNASARTITVPPNSDVAFTVGTVIECFRLGAGSLTIEPGTGVTLLQPTGAPLTARVQHSAVSLRKRATDTWVVGGDLG